MTTLFLIAHKVRGEPAFDIATCEEVDGEEHWIIPTSGHRAYPMMTWNMHDIGIRTDTESCLSEASSITEHHDWASIPDHYTTRATPRATKAEPPDFIKRMLANRPPTTPINRRGM